MRLLASQDPRWWLAIGGCAGVASEAKWNIAFLLAALAAGFLLTDARRLLASRYLLIGGLLAAALAAPDVVLAGRARLARPGRVPRAADVRPGTTGPSSGRPRCSTSARR